VETSGALHQIEDNLWRRSNFEVAYLTLDT